MGKKLNLVLREPVKLHELRIETPTLPAQFEEKESEEGKDEITEVPKSRAFQAEKKSETKPENEEELKEILRNMSPRVRQIWDYFCEAARADGNLQNSFVVTRNEVMKKAGIGSTNTYRDALGKFKNEGLIKIELRPGVNSGSIFYLTKKGRELTRMS